MQRWRALFVVVVVAATILVGRPMAASASGFVQVGVDMRPGSTNPTLNPTTRAAVPVAVLTTADFDAATVDPGTACFGDPNNALQRDCTLKTPRGVLEDVDGDGDLDLLLHFQADETGVDADDTSACLSAATTTGDQVWGCDALRVIHGAPEPTPPDLGVVVTPTVPTVDPLEPVGWTATVGNDGPGGVTLAPGTALVRLELPAAVTGTGVTGPAGWTCTMGTPTEATCRNADPETLAVGGTRAFSVVGVAPATPGPLTLTGTADPLGLVAEVDETDNTSAGAVTVRTGDLGLVLGVTPGVSNGGDVVSWRADVDNAGPGSVVVRAGARLLRFDAPAGLVGVSAIGPSGWACSVAGTVTSCTTAAGATIPVGAVLSFVLEGTVPSVQGEVDVSATVDPDGLVAEADETDNTANAGTVVRAPNLVVTVDASPAAPAPGEAVSWTTTVRNAGPGSLRLPAGTALVRLDPAAGLTGTVVTPAGGYTCTPDASGSVLCTADALDQLAAGDTRVFVLQGTPTAGSNALSATADPTSAVHETDEADNTATHTVQVGLPDLSVTVTPSAPEVDARSAVQWAIRLGNDGPGGTVVPTGTPIFQIQLPAGLANVFLTSPGGHSCYLAATNLVECALTAALPLGPGEHRDYTLGALAPTQPGPITTTVTVDPTGAVAEQDETDNVGAGTAVVRTPDLSVTITPSDTQVDPRQSVSWAITIANDGPGAAFIPNGTVLFQIQLPAGLANVFLTSPGGHSCYLAATNLVECATTATATMAAGTSRSYTLGALAPSTPGAITTAITVDTNNVLIEVDETDNDASASLTVLASDLRPTITVTPNEADVRQAVTWPITIENDGPGAAFVPNGTVLFQIQLPAGLANVFLTSPGGHSCYLAATNLVECAVTSTLTIAAGTSLSYTLGALAPAEPGNYTTSITVDPLGLIAEADETDNTALSALTVRAPDLSVTITDSADPVTTRQAISWPITITNDGPGAMVLTSGRPFFQIQLPPGLANVFLTSPGGHSCYLAATNLVECATTSTLTLAAGSSLSYTLGALAPDTPGTMTVTVTVDPSSHVSEANEGDNTASEITTVVAGS